MMTGNYDATWVERFYETRRDPARWRQVLDLELRACREPGCVDMGTHTIAVARKPTPRKGHEL